MRAARMAASKNEWMALRSRLRQAGKGREAFEKKNSEKSKENRHARQFRLHFRQTQASAHRGHARASLSR